MSNNFKGNVRFQGLHHVVFMDEEKVLTLPYINQRDAAWVRQINFDRWDDGKPISDEDKNGLLEAFRELLSREAIELTLTP